MQVHFYTLVRIQGFRQTKTMMDGHNKLPPTCEGKDVLQLQSDLIGYRDVHLPLLQSNDASRLGPFAHPHSPSANPLNPRPSPHNLVADSCRPRVQPTAATLQAIQDHDQNHS